MMLAIALLTLFFILMALNQYSKEGWQRYTLTDNEWHRLCLHLQTLEKTKGG